MDCNEGRHGESAYQGTTCGEILREVTGLAIGGHTRNKTRLGVLVLVAEDGLSYRQLRQIVHGVREVKRIALKEWRTVSAVTEFSSGGQ